MCARPCGCLVCPRLMGYDLETMGKTFFFKRTIQVAVGTGTVGKTSFSATNVESGCRRRGHCGDACNIRSRLESQKTFQGVESAMSDAPVDNSGPTAS